MSRRSPFKITRTAQIAAIAGATVLALTACGSSSGDGSGGGGTSSIAPPSNPALAALFAKARAEGGLTIYGNVQSTQMNPVLDGFKKTYGISVDYQQFSTSALSTRYGSEAAAGATAADAIVGSACAFIGTEEQSGVMTDIAKAALPDYPASFPASFQRTSVGSAAVEVVPWGIGYNTDSVSAADVPKTWQDLLQPKWKGKIGLLDPTTSITNTLFYNWLIGKYGAGFVKQLAAQAKGFDSTSGTASQALGAGEHELIVPTAAQVIDQVKALGAPVGFAQPDVTTGSDICVGLTTKANHPDAARLFLDYILSKPGNDELNAQPGSSGAYGAGSALPSGYELVGYSTTPAIVATVKSAVGR